MFVRREIRVAEAKDHKYPQVDDDNNNNCYYEYNHATGKHILKNGKDSNEALPPPSYSWNCICCNLVDLLMFVGYIAFLYFAIRYALYCLENYGNDGGE